MQQLKSKKLVTSKWIPWYFVHAATDKSLHTILISNSDLANFTKKHWEFENMGILSIEALICGCLEPKNLRAGLQNKAATPLQLKTIQFHLKGRGGFVWMPTPPCLELQGTEYQSFQMRYNTLFQLKWFSKYKPSKLKKRKILRFPYLNGHFFDRSTLTDCIFRTTALWGKIYRRNEFWNQLV